MVGRKTDRSGTAQVVMPELPDVECNRRYLERTALNQPVAKVLVRHERVLGNTSPEQLGAVLHGRCFERGHRYGSHLLVAIEGGPMLHMHFGTMSRLDFLQNGCEPSEAGCALFLFDNGCALVFDAPRMLGEISLEDGLEPFVQARGLGPDILDVGAVDFVERLAAHRGTIKGALMRQEVLAGVGNVYSDEILFQARVHPRAETGSLRAPVLEELHACAVEVLSAAIETDADPRRMPESYLLPCRRQGAPCPRCRREIRRIEVAGGYGYYCPTCQPPS